MLMSSRSGKLDGHTFEWLDNQSKKLFANCDLCHAKVFPDAPRMRLHDGKGKMRAGSKGAESSYWCMKCARGRGLHPPIPDAVGVQEGMVFDA